MKRELRLLGVGVIATLLLYGWGYISPQAQQATGWVIVGYTPEVGGEGEAVVGLGDSILIVGQAAAERLADLWLFFVRDDGSLVLDTMLPSPPSHLKSGTALAWDQRGCVYTLTGGAQRDTGRKDFLCLDLCAKEWEELSETPYDQGAGDALAYLRLPPDGKPYIYALFGVQNVPGGRSGFGRFARYDIKNDVWEELPQPWDCTDDGAALAWGGGRYLYALHGTNCQDQPTKDFARFDLTAQTPGWEALPDIPAPVDDGGSLIWDGGNYLYAVTGGAGEEAKGTTPKGFYRFDLTKQEWQTLDPLPCPIGDYVGNRLAYVKGYIFAWQGSYSTRDCGGKAIMRYRPPEGS
jgi:N-acetylneuraminic acid mutarotase